MGSCVCEAGYTGATCVGCAPGYVLEDDGETCVPEECADDGDCPDAGGRWVDQWGTDKNDQILAMALDEDGELFVVGRTAGELEGHVSSGGGADQIAGGRLRAGSERWTEQWGTGATEEATGLVLADDGGLFVSGHSSGALGEDSFGLADAVLTRLTEEHAIDWTVQWGTAAADRPTKMVLSSDEALIVLGATAGNLGRSNPDATKSDVFVTKLSTAGDEAWTTQWGAEGNDFGFGLAAGPAGSTFVAGSTAGSIEGGQYEGGIDLFCSKIDADGDIEWTLQWGSGADEYAHAVAVLPSGEALVVSDRGIIAADEGEGAMLITKITAGGAIAWTYAFGATNSDTPRAIALAEGGAFYVAGETHGDLVADGHMGMADFFVTLRDADGMELWTQQYGTAMDEKVHALAVGSETIYVAGSTEGSAGVSNLGLMDNLTVGFEVP
jgi:hypothetical protein